MNVTFVFVHEAPGSWIVCLGGVHGDVVEGQRWKLRGSSREGGWGDS